MIKCILRIIVLQTFIFYTSNSKCQDFQWVKQSKGHGVTREVKVANGDAGEVYLIRNFDDNVNYENKSFKTNGRLDFSIAKYNSKGELEWALSNGGKGNDEIKDIVCDKYGEILVTGYFSESILLDEIQLTSSGLGDIFIAKYDKRGRCKWAISSGGAGFDAANSIKIDTDDNIIITGLFSQTAKFNSLSIDAIGSSDIFVAKYDKKRQLVWLKSIIGYDDRSESTSLVINKNNDVVIAGNFYNNLLVENNPILSDSNFVNLNLPNSFLISLDKTGKLMWMKCIVSMTNDSFIIVSKGLACDDRGNVYLSGGVSGLAYANQLKLLSESPGNQDLFFASCSQSGNWNWVKTSVGEDLRYGRDMTTSLLYKNEMVYGVGYFDGLLRLDNVILSSNGIYDSDIFIIALNNKGEAVWGKSAGSSNDRFFEFNDVANDIAVNERGEIFISGWFNGDAKFETVHVNSNKTKEVFLAKMDKAQSIVPYYKSDADSTQIIVYPNPVVADNFNVRIEGTGDRTTVIMYDELGNIVNVIFEGKTKKKETYSFIIKGNELPRGTYQIKVVSKNENLVTRVMVIK